MEVVQGAWSKPVSSSDPIRILDTKLTCTAKALRSWGQRKQSRFALLFQIANEVILRFDEAQEHRSLSEEERKLRAFLKGKCLALASLEITRLRQRARIRDIQEGDANTKYFHMKANSRRRKHLIPILKHNDRAATTTDDKLELAEDYFSEVLGTAPRRQRMLNLDAIPFRSLSPSQVRDLEAPFSREEVRKVVMDMPSDRAPGPDGFSGLFFKLCWDVIANDLLAALKQLHDGRFHSFRRLNGSILTLLPKKENPLDIKEFRPISLIHGISKIFTKLLASRLAPLLPSLISHAQSAFVQTRSIHENFKLVANAAKFLHRKKKSAVLMKIDISKAFDTLSWEFLIEILKRRGFSERWCMWICGILATAYTRILINGQRGRPINLARGVCQGDPLSPSLFILAMDSLYAILQWASEHALLADLGMHHNTPRVSIYADDAVLFFSPKLNDLEVIKTVLNLFANASGLSVNLQKSSITCIRCDEDVATMVANHFRCTRKDFPITYLGLPLTTGRLRRADILPLIDKYSSKLKGWKPRFLYTSGRLTLTRSVLMALPLHLLSVLPLPQWALDIINRRCRGFVWKGEEDVNGGHCLLPWSRVCRPTQVGGLGILNLRLFGTALRCRWPWLQWTPEQCPWSLIPLADDQYALELFKDGAFVRLGDGRRAKFWVDSWLPGGRTIQDVVPILFSFIRNSGITVATALFNNRWVRDIQGGI